MPFIPLIKRLLEIMTVQLYLLPLCLRLQRFPPAGSFPGWMLTEVLCAGMAAGCGDRARGPQGGVWETTKRSGKEELCRRLMSECWCHRSVSPAPGKGVKGEQGLGGQDRLEESQTSARKLRPQPCGSCALLSLVCCSTPRNHQWQVLGDHRDRDKELRRDWEGDVTQGWRDLGPISASQGCLGLPLHDIAIARHEIVPKLCWRGSWIQFPGEAKPGLGVLVGQ